ncbi:MAG: DegV family protein, partial [Solirubrobacterales bacterium]|nr:DegV family protein [Solirubrobacterales bacterium]
MVGVIQPRRVSSPSQTAVVADTTSYLPQELIDKHDIKLVSLYVGLEGSQEREIEITDYDEFYERLRGASEAITTSQPSVGDFLEVYEPLLAEGKEIVSVHLSSQISGTYESALQARERLSADGGGGERIHVVDSRTAAGGFALIILAAAHAAETKGGAETAKWAQDARETMKIFFAVDTLEYLRRGGRIGAASAWIG